MNHLTISTYLFIALYGSVGTAILLYEFEVFRTIWKSLIVFLPMVCLSTVVVVCVGNVSILGPKENFNDQLSRNYPLLTFIYLIIWFVVNRIKIRKSKRL